MEENNNEIKTLLQENIELNKEILSLCKEIEHHNKLSRIYGFVKTIIIVIPLIVGILYLIPFFGQMFKGLNMYSQTMTELLK
jgi:hypothetical protein